MTSLLYSDPEVVIALNRLIICVNPNDLQIFKEIVVPEDLTKCGLSAIGNDDKEEEAQHKPSNDDKNNEKSVIQQVHISPNHELMAVSTAGQKALLLYQLRLEHAKLVSVRSLARTCSAMSFSKDCKRLLVTDKTGDCYEYNCEDLLAEAKVLFGHLSIVYDVAWSPNENYIITCDRDGKIRVTNYPETYDIHGYCLGHKEFVSALCFIANDILISVSGDETLRLWNIEKCTELTKLGLVAPAIKLAVRCLATDEYLLAVLLHQPNECIGLYKLVQIKAGENDTWQFSEDRLLSFPGMIGCNLSFAEDKLYVVGVVDDRLSMKVAEVSPKPPENWLKMIEEQFKEIPWQPEDINNWFKKKYDNVSEYLERKKRRIEEKHS